jgi:hypothetical protein
MEGADRLEVSIVAILVISCPHVRFCSCKVHLSVTSWIKRSLSLLLTCRGMSAHCRRLAINLLLPAYCNFTGHPQRRAQLKMLHSHIGCSSMQVRCADTNRNATAEGIFKGLMHLLSTLICQAHEVFIQFGSLCTSGGAV